MSNLHLRKPAALFPIVWIAFGSILFALEDTQDFDFFERKIRPLLIERCQGCHGEAKQWASLRLDSAEALQRGGESGPVIQPTKWEESELLVRICSSDDSQRMPPPESGPALTGEQIQSIKQWVLSGAPWPKTDSKQSKSPAGMIDIEKARSEHWAFRAPVMPTIPALHDGLNHQVIDAFVQTKLKSAGLSASPAADRRSLIRRATYDLTGLPPTSDEVAQFLSDSSQDAYPKLIDRLLASPRYGEKWGRLWLDVARYADTKGYVYGREERFFTHASLYRDWVVRAFNDDMPYDRFLLLQLAADLAAPNEPDALAAMGFLTVGRRFLGVTPDIMDDRIDVVCRGLMGLTVGCARCHDHKYDPIPTADYYSLYGVFQNSIEREIAGSKSTVPPPSDEFIQGLREREKKYHDYLEAQCDEAETRFRKRISEYLLSQRELDKYPELTFNQISTKEELLPGAVHRWEAFLERAEQLGDPVFDAWIAYSKIKDSEFLEKSPEVTQALQQRKESLHPTVAAAFTDPPPSIQNVAQRYGQLFEAVDKAWTERCDAAKRDNQPPPKALPNETDEALRQALYAPDSPCKIPRESMANIEWLWDNATVVELWRLQGEIDRWVLQNPMAEPHYVALVDQNAIYEPRVFRRGNPANKGAVVPRQFLAAIQGNGRQPFQTGSGRLELAKAIIDPTNPLTARVWVNRVWQNHFGKGLVDSPSDFGARASPPSHPELLDWLALQFVKENWSTRWLHRIMMLSETYQQSSSGPVTHEEQSRAHEQDPDNRLLWRMNPRRLSFEEMRDTMVAVSDGFDWTMGGKAVDVFSPTPSGKFRRSIYGQIDRQYLPTVFNVFDFANPDLHSPQRNETTVPQQALFNLNHPFVAGRARAMAARALQTETDNTARIRRLFEWTFQREPTPQQLANAIQFVTTTQSTSETPESENHRKAWSYGYGSIDESSQRTKSFEKLPYSTATLWQGGVQLPDAALGWVHIGARTIHSGNDKNHSAIRRWTAPRSGTVVVRSNASHDHPQGDGVRGVLLSSRHGILQSTVLFNQQSRFDTDKLEVQPGDTIDFIVELHETLSFEDLTWSPSISMDLDTEGLAKIEWDAEKNFRTNDNGVLSPWEQLAQVLLISNESIYLD